MPHWGVLWKPSPHGLLLSFQLTCWGQVPKKHKSACLKLLSDLFSISRCLMEQSWIFASLASLEPQTESCFLWDSYPEPSLSQTNHKLAAWIDRWIRSIFSSAQLVLSQEVDGFRLWLLSISLLWRRGRGVLDTGPEQASLQCFPVCQLVNKFGHLQVELGPLSKARWSSTVTLFVLWDTVEQFRAGPPHRVAGWCRLTPAVEGMAPSLTSSLRNDT